MLPAPQGPATRSRHPQRTGTFRLPRREEPKPAQHPWTPWPDWRRSARLAPTEPRHSGQSSAWTMGTGLGDTTRGVTNFRRLGTLQFAPSGDPEPGPPTRRGEPARPTHPATGPNTPARRPAAAPRKEEEARRRTPTKPPQGEPVRLNGVMFGGLRAIQRDPLTDPPRRTCFNCWGADHNKAQCPRPATRHGNNCGRRGVDLASCPRCAGDVRPQRVDGGARPVARGAPTALTTKGRATPEETKRSRGTRDDSPRRKEGSHDDGKRQGATGHL